MAARFLAAFQSLDFKLRRVRRFLFMNNHRQIQARLKAAGFDPGPIDGILGPKTRSVLLRVQAACTIVNDLVATADSEIFAPAVETQPPELTGSATTRSKAEIQLLQRRLNAAGFDPGPIDGILGARTRSAISRCKSGCTALNDLSDSSDKPVFGQNTEIQSPRTSASAKPTASVNNVFKNQEIRLAQERLKAAGLDPGPLMADSAPKPNRHSRSTALPQVDAFRNRSPA
jgi:peptidoglycan hydrolase-like protein with peptidoglycan-binding domain